MMTSIGQVINQLKHLVAQCEASEDPVGYFAALYLDVTQLVADAIASGNVFEHSKAVEQLDINFAKRYFDAIDAYHHGQQASMPWQVCFEATNKKGIVVDQHFLAAANAHINYDLAIAVAKTFRGSNISFMQNDFNALNQLLFSMNNAVNGMIKKIWPFVGILLKLFGKPMLRIEDSMMKKDRDKAWQYALQLAPANDAEWEIITKQMEMETYRLGHAILHPPWPLTWLFKYIAKKERGNVASRIQIMLQQKTTASE